VAEFTNEAAQTAIFTFFPLVYYCISSKYSMKQGEIRESGAFDQRLKWNDVNLPKLMIWGQIQKFFHLNEYLVTPKKPEKLNYATEYF
jgi:hypothetical protein